MSEIDKKEWIPEEEGQTSWMSPAQKAEQDAILAILQAIQRADIPQLPAGNDEE